MKRFNRLLSILLASVMLLSVLAVIPAAAEGETAWATDFNGSTLKPEERISAGQNRLVYALDNEDVLTGQKGSTMVAKGVLYGLAVDPEQRYAFAGFVGGEANQRVVEMIDLYSSVSVGYWQYKNANGDYANPRALSADNSGNLFVGMDGTADGIQVAVVSYDKATGKMVQKSVTQVLAQPDGVNLICHAIKYYERNDKKYVYVLTGDGVDNNNYTQGQTNYDRLYRFILNDDLTLTLDTDSGFGRNEDLVVGGGYIVIAVGNEQDSGSWNQYGAAEAYGFDIRSDGRILVGLGRTYLNATCITEDGYCAARFYEKTEGKNWAACGPIAFVEDQYLVVMNNNYGDDATAKNQMLVYNGWQNEGQYTYNGAATGWELPSTNSRYDRNVCNAMYYVGGNLYYINTGSETSANGDYGSKDADQIWVMSLTQEGNAKANKIMGEQAGRTSDLKTVWAQSNGSILTADGQTLKKATGTLNGFAVSADEKYAFLGFTGGEAANRALEMINLKTGASLGAYQYAVGDTFANPRAADAYQNGSLFVGLDGTSEGVVIAKLDYTADGTMTKAWTHTVVENAGLIVREVLYRVIGGTEYLYVMVTDGAVGAETNAANDLIYRFRIGENGLTADTAFGDNGSTNVRELSSRSAKYFTELYGLDVDENGTMYVSAGAGSVSVAALDANGTQITGEFWSNGGDSVYGAIICTDRFVFAPVTEGDHAKELMAWIKEGALRAEFQNADRAAYDATSNVFVHMRMVNGTLYVADRGAGETTTSVDANADKIWSVKYECATVDGVKTVDFRTSEVTDGKYNVRFTAALDSKNYKNAGFEISYTYTDAEGKTVTKTYELDKTACTDAYIGITGMGATLRARSLGGEYLFAMTIVDVPTSIGEITFTVRSYAVDLDGNTIYESEEANTFTVSAHNA